ncbi:B3 domain-containing transcription factor VRN1-like, partial [Cornus florida]|uniref:B3 domain-containing transcription factor VRN1-like n=1 Tax=Cornus florida TaxID=4283 RepID=UPI0028A20D32
SDGDVWLQNGWQEFKVYYSIGHGHLLVFRYDGNSHFHVLIFDLSGTEIEYPFSDIHVEQTNNNAGYEMPNTDGIEVDDSDEILNDFPACQTREIIKECIGGMATTPRHLHSKAPEGRRRGGRASAEKDIAFQRAKAYIGRSFLHEEKCVPLVFARKYFADKQDIVLRVSDGRTWSVKCNFSKTNAKISGGWQSFVEDNNLKVGDVCVFQLINGIEPSLKVIIF